jgi:FMN phosphatase YigB (HAD superfamily)/carbamoylphosphate synthase large subunit
MRPTNVLVSGGGFQGLGLIKALRAVREVRVLIADRHAENVARYFADAFFPAPPLEEKQELLDFFLDLCTRESISAVFASTEYELELLAHHRETLAACGTTVYVSDMPLLELAGDKLLFYRWLLNEGLPCLPIYTTPLDANATFPLIGKPRRGWGGRNLHILADRKAFFTLSIDQNEFVWQPCLGKFDEYSIDFSIDVAGDISPLAFRRRIRSMDGFAILCEPGAPLHVRETARRVLEHMVPLGARGPMNLQILRMGDDCWVSDFNSRAGTSMPLSLTVGINPIAFLLAGGTGEISKADESFTSGLRARTLRYLEERSIPDLQLDEVRGIVFSLDDTLLDQKAWMMSKLEQTWYKEREREKTILPGRTEFLSVALQFIEEGNRDHLFDALCLQLDLDDAIRLQLIETYRHVLPEDRPLYNDVMVTLYQLHRLGYRIGVLTDKPPASQRQKLDVCGLLPLIDALVLTEELGMQKPDPKVFAECARLLDLPPGQLVMVGSNLFRDMQGSCNAGYRHAFHIQRAGASFNFNPDLMRRTGNVMPACTSISSLNELLWYLNGL